MATDKLFRLTDTEFGDAYHVGAAMVLCSDGPKIAVEVAPGTSKADALYYFLSSLGSRDQVTRHPVERKADPLRHSTELIHNWARACKTPEDRDRGIQDISRCFLQSLESNDKDAVEGFLRRHRDLLSSTRKVLLWVRNRQDYDPWRNTSSASIQQLFEEMRSHGLLPVLIGYRLPALNEAPFGAGNLIDFFRDPTFSDIPKISIARQLWMFQRLMSRDYNVVAQIGLVSGGMDGPALLMLPTVEFAPPNNAQRMGGFETLLGQSFKVVRLPEYSEPNTFKEFSRHEIAEMVHFLASNGAIAR